MATPDAYLCRSRAAHVFGETQRVLAFNDACARCAAGTLAADECIQVRGRGLCVWPPLTGQRDAGAGRVDERQPRELPRPV
jgi:hypothetical protein